MHGPASAGTAGQKTIAVRPRDLAFGIAGCLLLSIAVLAAIGYFLLQSGMLPVKGIDHTAVETEYQDRIDRLRAEIERLTSRQIVDRETVEVQVLDLLRRQHDLSQRHALVEDLVARAEQVGIYLGKDKPLPLPKPDFANAAANSAVAGSSIGGESELIGDPLKALGLRATNPVVIDPLDILQATDGMAKNTAPATPPPAEHSALEAVDEDITAMGARSTEAIDAIAVATESRIENILDITARVTPGLADKLRKAAPAGGPFVALDNPDFDTRLNRAQSALNMLKRVKHAALRLPVKHPVRNAPISSAFGPRVDPFLKRLAMHTGTDFKAPYGARVFAAAPGTVSEVKWAGGYGKMIEIRHANGIRSRYAHLSRFQVKKGDHVVAGDTIGNVGSTGRSTGPHLHYEVRKGEKPVNPALFFAAGTELAKLVR